MRKSATPDEPDGRIRVLVVDGHRLSRVGLSSLLGSVGFAVVGEAEDALTAAAMVRGLHPHVALIDLDQLERSGVEAVRLIAASSPPSRVVAITTAVEGQDVVGTLAAGACAYILKESPTHEIVAAIRAAARGESILSPRIAGRLVRWLRLQPANAGSAPALSSRELEVLELLVRGWDNAQIAAALYMSRGTVKHHISSILTKLGVDNRIQAAVRAIEQGLLDRY